MDFIYKVNEESSMTHVKNIKTDIKDQNFRILLGQNENYTKINCSTKDLLKEKDKKIEILQEQCHQLKKKLEQNNNNNQTPIFKENSNTSTNFPTKNEIKQLWEEFALVSLLDNFIDYEENPEIIFHLVSEMIIITEKLITDLCLDMYKKVSVSLNIIDDKKFINDIEKTSRPLIKEHLHKTFADTNNQAFMDKFKNIFLESVVNIFKKKEIMFKDFEPIIKGEDFKIMIKKIKDIVLFTKFNDQQLFFYIEKDINKRIEEKIKINNINEKKNYLIINDNNKENFTALIILKPPVLKTGFPPNNNLKTIIFIINDENESKKNCSEKNTIEDNIHSSLINTLTVDNQIKTILPYKKLFSKKIFSKTNMRDQFQKIKHKFFNKKITIDNKNLNKKYDLIDQENNIHSKEMEDELNLKQVEDDLNLKQDINNDYLISANNFQYIKFPENFNENEINKFDIKKGNFEAKNRINNNLKHQATISNKSFTRKMSPRNERKHCITFDNGETKSFLSNKNEMEDDFNLTNSGKPVMIYMKTTKIGIFNNAKNESSHNLENKNKLILDEMYNNKNFRIVDKNYKINLNRLKSQLYFKSSLKQSDKEKKYKKITNKDNYCSKSKSYRCNNKIGKIVDIKNNHQNIKKNNNNNTLIQVNNIREDNIFKKHKTAKLMSVFDKTNIDNKKNNFVTMKKLKQTNSTSNREYIVKDKKSKILEGSSFNINNCNSKNKLTIDHTNSRLKHTDINVNNRLFSGLKRKKKANINKKILGSPNKLFENSKKNDTSSKDLCYKKVFNCKASKSSKNHKTITHSKTSKQTNKKMNTILSNRKKSEESYKKEINLSNTGYKIKNVNINYFNIMQPNKLYIDQIQNNQCNEQQQNRSNKDLLKRPKSKPVEINRNINRKYFAQKHNLNANTINVNCFNTIKTKQLYNKIQIINKNKNQSFKNHMISIENNNSKKNNQGHIIDNKYFSISRISNQNIYKSNNNTKENIIRGKFIDKNIVMYNGNSTGLRDHLIKNIINHNNSFEDNTYMLFYQNNTNDCNNEANSKSGTQSNRIINGNYCNIYSNRDKINNNYFCFDSKIYYNLIKKNN